MKVLFIGYMVFMLLVVCMVGSAFPQDEGLWRITAYCGCTKCCGKWSDGHFASGRKVYVGAVACNWLPFRTKVKIDGLGVYTVEDRGAKSLFGDKDNHIKHLDVFFHNHEDAKRFGNQYRNVEIL